jgi:hypothetical protein
MVSNILRKLAVLCFCLVVCSFTTGAFADIIWDNGPADVGGAASQRDTNLDIVGQTADDFVLPTGPGGEAQWSITGVTWSGTYNGAVGVPDEFNLILYADDGTGNAPTGAGMADPTPTALFAPRVSFASVNETPTALGFDYSHTLDSPWTVDANTKYWFVAQSDMDFPPQWLFATSVSSQLHGWVQGFPIFNVPYWEGLGVGDAAFTLVGVPVPEPATIGLLTIGALAMLRRRR